MIEVVWKGGAEQDLLRIFADLDDFREGAGADFTGKLDASLQNLGRAEGVMEQKGSGGNS